MNGLSLVASLVQTLAWPIITLVIVILLRKNVAHILDRILEIRAGKLFTLKLQGAEQLLKESRRELHPPLVNLESATERQLAAPPNSKKQMIGREQLAPLTLTEVSVKTPDEHAFAGVDPAVEVEMVWKDLRRQILKAARENGLKGARSLGPAITHLIEKGLIPAQFQEAFEKVQAVYKAIQRYPGLPIDQTLAKEFLTSCSRLQLHVAQILTHS
ncbi:MAG: hypothetical protein ABSD59_21900 [Terracidiphilus sp.]